MDVKFIDLLTISCFRFGPNTRFRGPVINANQIATPIYRDQERNLSLVCLAPCWPQKPYYLGMPADGTVPHLVKESTVIVIFTFTLYGLAYILALGNLHASHGTKKCAFP